MAFESSKEALILLVVAHRPFILLLTHSSSLCVGFYQRNGLLFVCWSSQKKICFLFLIMFLKLCFVDFFFFFF